MFNPYRLTWLKGRLAVEEAKQRLMPDRIIDVVNLRSAMVACSSRGPLQWSGLRTGMQLATPNGKPACAA